jgi:hypothetical protein
MVDVLAAPQQLKADTSLRTLAAFRWRIGQPFPYVRAADAVSVLKGNGCRLYRTRLYLTVFGLVSGCWAPIGYLADHIGARVAVDRSQCRRAARSCSACI